MSRANEGRYGRVTSETATSIPQGFPPKRDELKEIRGPFRAIFHCMDSSVPISL